MRGILCIGNPVLFWLSPISLTFLLYRYLKKRTWALGIILAGFLSQWLPYVFVKRVQFFHYIYTALPFLCMATAVLLARLWRSSYWNKWIVGLYFLMIVVSFFYWYPLLVGYPISEQFFRQHMWFRVWI